MSGHSKWSTIKRQKGAADVKRGKVFTKISNAITIAVKQGGGVGDPNHNPRLRLAIDSAKAVNMPKANIDRAILRASGSNATEMMEVVYEGFGPGGFSVIVHAVTDNKLRTNAEVKNLFEKQGGTFGSPGSVSYQFEQVGLLLVTKKRDVGLDEQMMLLIEAGATDIDEAGEEMLVYTSSNELAKVRDRLHQQGFAVQEAKIVRKPTVMNDLGNSESVARALAFTTSLEDHQDVQDVFTNISVTDTLM